MTETADPSRRDFLLRSAAGLLGLAGMTGSATAGPRRARGAADELLYVGTYAEGENAEGIHLVRMNPRTGELRLAGVARSGANPSFLAIHPNGRVLYAANETTEHNGKATGTVTSFAIADESGALTRLNQEPSGGGAPCYVSVDRSGRALLVANYVGGSVALLPITETGRLGTATQVVQHMGTGPNAERQEAPHAHCILPDPSNRFVLAADLGVDRVMVYRLDVESGTLAYVETGDARLRPGAGPRHIAFHPTLPLVFVANELDSTVTTLQFDGARGYLSVMQTVSTLPTGWTGTNYPADIHLASAGGTLYVSNRGHNSIAVFSVSTSTGAFVLEQSVSTEGDWPRNFTLDPTGRWLLVANQRSGTIVVFARDPESGRLTPTNQRISVASPVCLRFLAPDTA